MSVSSFPTINNDSFSELEFRVQMYIEKRDSMKFSDEEYERKLRNYNKMINNLQIQQEKIVGSIYDL
jgi:hypothetical protein